MKANISAELWPYVDPATEADPEPLLTKPPRPVPKDFDQNAETFAQLSQANRKALESARKIFAEDQKDYLRQIEQVRAARAYIMSTVSGAKQLILDDDKSLQEWTKALKEDTKPPSGYINTRVVIEYNTIVWKKSQRGVKWVDE